MYSSHPAHQGGIFLLNLKEFNVSSVSDEAFFSVFIAEHTFEFAVCPE